MKLLCGDCLEVMKEIEAQSIDAIICDPPYGATQNAWDAIIPFEPMWSQLKRIIKSRAVIVFTASQPFTSALIMSNPSWFRHEWIWHKNKASGHLNAKKSPMKAHENIIVFAEKTPYYNPQMTTGHKPVSAFYTRHNGQNYGEGDLKAGGGSTVRYPLSVQYFAIINNDDPNKIHPTQKPVALFEYLIKTYTRENETVLDFCMGSGTTGEACKNTSREFIGIEKDIEMFNLAKRRLDLL